jgi:hypothetical protein
MTRVDIPEADIHNDIIKVKILAVSDGQVTVEVDGHSVALAVGEAFTSMHIRTATNTPKVRRVLELIEADKAAGTWPQDTAGERQGDGDNLP